MTPAPRKTEQRGAPREGGESQYCGSLGGPWALCPQPCRQQTVLSLISAMEGILEEDAHKGGSLRVVHSPRPQSSDSQSPHHFSCGGPFRAQVREEHPRSCEISPSELHLGWSLSWGEGGTEATFSECPGWTALGDRPSSGDRPCQAQGGPHSCGTTSTARASVFASL